ncbi:hypothetical protein HHK36_022199 [Tetracentron sinense]|uniref:E3 ubiquitin-protein ligase n=1 Tax=Tetracentron sinense TaxID=13715 RepID=A0A835D6J4_TETSI|nr:hypothetical protein HHK36_022199 [Tetracentron sinense]
MASLIEDLLKKFAELDAGCMTKMQRLAPEVVCHLPQSVPNSYINILGSASDAEERKAKARERQAAILHGSLWISTRSSILDHVDTGLLYPDIQFWKRASDPILAWDPFSSLMWILFCLPCPFLSSMESFLSLVHLFYVVCVTQAIITYHGKCLLDITELGFDIIRRLSSPYLRRCALLWKILNSYTSALFYDRSRYANNDMLYGTGTSGLLVELKEVEELENMFKIPPLDVVLKDEVMRALVIKWSLHFCKEFKVHRFGRALHSTPALPFKLMCLPHIYEDLLQRTSPHYVCCVVDYALLAGRLAAVKYATLTWLLQLLFKGKRMPDSCDGLWCWYWIFFVDQEPQSYCKELHVRHLGLLPTWMPLVKR